MKNITNEIVKKFEQYLYEEEKSDNTIEKYMRDVRFFREWLCGKDSLFLEATQYGLSVCGCRQHI